VHLYAYAGFPRSIRGLQTFMKVLEDRVAKGIVDEVGAEATSVEDARSKFDRGKAVLDSLLGVPQTDSPTGYAAFAPVIEVFLKEHLFADIFERDVLTYAEGNWLRFLYLQVSGVWSPCCDRIWLFV